MESPEGLSFVQHFAAAWIESGALWTPASSKKASQGESKKTQVGKHAMGDFVCACNWFGCGGCSMESPEGLSFVPHFSTAWIESGALWTPASLKKQARVKARWHKLGNMLWEILCLHVIDVVVAVAAWNHQKGLAFSSAFFSNMTQFRVESSFPTLFGHRNGDSSFPWCMRATMTHDKLD
jgi:hypothetical protein